MVRVELVTVQCFPERLIVGTTTAGHDVEVLSTIETHRLYYGT